MICASRVISFIGLLALAASLPLSERGEQTEWDPRITYPNQYTEWCVGESYQVLWDTSNPPSQVTNPMGKIYLVGSAGLDYKYPLAQDFPLAAGQVTITVPTVTPGPFSVDLFGDSGNWSQQFQIAESGC